MAKKFRVRLVRSLIGTTDRQKAGMAALGLKRINDEVVVNDSPAMRGQIHHLQHLLDVKAEK